MKQLIQLMPSEVAETLSEENQHARQKKAEVADAWLIRLHRERPLLYWIFGIAIGLALWAFSYGFAVFLDWLTK